MSTRVLAAAGALALATALSSCGFDYSTDRVYTPGAGVNDRDARVDVLGAVVVSAQDGSGTFIASFSNNDQEDATVSSMAGGGDDTDLQVTDFQPIQVPGGGLVNLAEDGGVVLEGDQVETGAFLTLEIGFGDGTSEELEVPVYPPCHEYEGLDESGDGTGTSDECTPESPAAGE
jgi:hypothetical protein